MSLWTLIKIVAGLVVLAVVVFTTLMVSHVRREPLGGVFTEWVPVTVEDSTVVVLPEAAAGLPEIDPGAKVFEKARERIAVGDLVEAGDKLRTVVNIYPRSKAAPEARRIVGEMNMDALLSTANMANKKLYEVKRGDSYLAIAKRHQTSLDLIMYLNGLMDLRSLQPQDELIVMTLNFKFLLDPGRKVLSLWDGDRLLKEYPLLAVEGAPSAGAKTVIEGKTGVVGERRFPPASAGYRGASKLLMLKKPALVIAAMPEQIDEQAGGLQKGFYLSPADLEELTLLARPGNEVEIRAISG